MYYITNTINRKTHNKRNLSQQQYLVEGWANEKVGFKSFLGGQIFVLKKSFVTLYCHFHGSQRLVIVSDWLPDNSLCMGSDDWPKIKSIQIARMAIFVPKNRETFKQKEIK